MESLLCALRTAPENIPTITLDAACGHSKPTIFRKRVVQKAPPIIPPSRIPVRKISGSIDGRQSDLAWLDHREADHPCEAKRAARTHQCKRRSSRSERPRNQVTTLRCETHRFVVPASAHRPRTCNMSLGSRGTPCVVADSRARTLLSVVPPTRRNTETI